MVIRQMQSHLLVERYQMIFDILKARQEMRRHETVISCFVGVLFGSGFLLTTHVQVPIKCM